MARAQALGDASYSIYLWHLMFATAAAGIMGPSVLSLVACVALGIGGGLAAFRWLEEPIRHGLKPGIPVTVGDRPARIRRRAAVDIPARANATSGALICGTCRSVQRGGPLRSILALIQPQAPATSRIPMPSCHPVILALQTIGLPCWRAARWRQLLARRLVARNGWPPSSDLAAVLQRDSLSCCPDGIAF